MELGAWDFGRSRPYLVGYPAGQTGSACPAFRPAPSTQSGGRQLMCCSSWTASRRTGLALSLVVGLVLVVPSLASAQAVTGTLLGNVNDSSGAAVPGATVTARETQTNVSRTHRYQRDRLLHLLQPPERHLRRRSGAAGFQEGRCAKNVKVDVNTHHPRRPEARGRAADGDGHGRGRNAAAADRSHRHRADHRVEDGGGAAAHLQPQLPVADADGARREPPAPRALAVLQLAGLAAGSKSTASRAWPAPR